MQLLFVAAGYKYGGSLCRSATEMYTMYTQGRCRLQGECAWYV